MEIKGTLLIKLPEVSGTSAKGEWKKQEAIIETVETYPKKVCLSFWGEKVDDLKPIKEGETINAHFNLESREHNNRWYTEARVWKLEPKTNDEKLPSVQSENYPEPIVSDNDDSVPF